MKEMQFNPTFSHSKRKYKRKSEKTCIKIAEDKNAVNSPHIEQRQYMIYISTHSEGDNVFLREILKYDRESVAWFLLKRYWLL